MPPTSPSGSGFQPASSHVESNSGTLDLEFTESEFRSMSGGLRHGRAVGHMSSRHRGLFEFHLGSTLGETDVATVRSGAVVKMDVGSLGDRKGETFQFTSTPNPCHSGVAKPFVTVWTFDGRVAHCCYHPGMYKSRGGAVSTGSTSNYTQGAARQS